MLVDVEINLLECLVVDKASSVLWDIQLPLLEMFAEFPGCRVTKSGLLKRAMLF